MIHGPHVASHVGESGGRARGLAELHCVDHYTNRTRGIVLGADATPRGQHVVKLTRHQCSIRHLHEEITRNHRCESIGERVDLTLTWLDQRGPFKIEGPMYQRLRAAA